MLHTPLTLFVIQAVVIIVLARVVGLLARRLGQPMVIAEVVAGIVLGPSLLGLLLPGIEGALFPEKSLGLLNLISQVGLIFFMFLIGLELDPKLLHNRGRASVITGHSSIFVPFALGALLSLYLYPRLSDSSVPFMSFCLFMGVAMSITAFPVLARILSEQRLMRTKIGAITIASAAVNDVTAWCVLAFVVSVARASGIDSAVKTTVLALAYIVLMFFVMRPFLARFGALSAGRQGLNQNVVAVTFIMLLLSSWITELIGIHALFGAFLFGVIMPREGGYTQSLAEKLEDFVVVFLLPMFFAYSGLRTQINLLNSPQMWLYCLLITTAACVGKFSGSAIAARLTGLEWREATAIGILMNTRGLMELIVLNIGLDLGVLSPELFTMMVVMALVTTFMTTPLLSFFYPRQEMAKQIEGELAEPAAAADTYTLVMCVAHDRTGPPMATLAAALNGKAANGVRTYGLRLIAPLERTSAYLLEERNTPDEGNALIPLLERSEELGLAVKPISFVSSEPGADICQVAKVKKADLILLGMHKPLFNQALLGGTVYQVMNGAQSDVAVLIDRGLSNIKRVLLPFNGSVHAVAALRLARRLNERSGAEIVVLHVTAPQRDHAARMGAQEQFASVFASNGKDKQNVSMKVVEHEHPAEAALVEAANKYDLVIVGVGQEWGLEERRFGVHSERIISECPTSLLVVKARE
jgi:Kef-type K+ transport system membrane component KefB